MSPGARGKLKNSDARLMHELAVHQVELRVQNEELLCSRTALEESRRRYFDLFHLSPVGCLMLEPSGAILDANLSAAELLGKPLAALLPGNLWHHVAADSRDAFDAHLRAAASGSSRVRAEITLLRQDGRTFAASVESSLIGRQDGGPPQVLTVIGDITERKTSEEASRNARLAAINVMVDAVAARGDAERLSNALLREIAVRCDTERELRRVMERSEVLAAAAAALMQAPDPSLAVQAACERLMAFLECEVFFNFLAEARPGKQRLNAFAGISTEEAEAIEDLEHGAGVCARVARDGRRIVLERVPSNPDESAALLASHGFTAYACHPLLGAGGEVIGTLAFGTRVRESFSEDDLAVMKTAADLVAIAMARFRAVAELRRTADELTRSNQDLERFAYISSHDLQEPLRMVTGFVTLLQERYQDRLDDKGREFMRQAVIGTSRMRQLIDDFLEYSRAGLGAAASEPVASHEALDDALANLAAMMAGCDATVTVGELPAVSVERAQLAAVFQNLIANAIKYRRAGVPPHIRVEARRDRDKWVLSVTDNGLGIPAEQFERIFVIFQRLHSREHSAGTGIGLAIVKRIVEANGGRVWVESRVGEGSVFFFALPA